MRPFITKPEYYNGQMVMVKLSYWTSTNRNTPQKARIVEFKDETYSSYAYYIVKMVDDDSTQTALIGDVLQAVDITEEFSKTKGS